MATTASARKFVHVQKAGGKTDVAMPAVFLAPIRTDIVRFVFTNMNKNRRQPYAVSELAGTMHSAHSWGTGRAVARVPRVSGSGTRRCAQAAFGNMCRDGRHFAPTKVWRKWHRKINVNQKRFAVASALAASALTSLVLGRGHNINKVAEIPLVVGDAAQDISTTKDAISFLKSVGAYPDVLRVKTSRSMRAGKGKMRGRRFRVRKGPLVVYSEDNGLVQAFRNITGVETCQVTRLNLLQLAPGGHLGRFIIWTQAAFAQLNDIYGSTTTAAKLKNNYTLPTSVMTTADMARLFSDDAIQSRLNPGKYKVYRKGVKKNPLKNFGVKVKLNPFAIQARRTAILEQEKKTARSKKIAACRRANAEFLFGDAAKASVVDAAKRSLKGNGADCKNPNFCKTVCIWSKSAAQGAKKTPGAALIPLIWKAKNPEATSVPEDASVAGIAADKTYTVMDVFNALSK